jgi:D-serine deaminase-like pyridoxal phosphate-dependent protein
VYWNGVLGLDEAHRRGVTNTRWDTCLESTAQDESVTELTVRGAAAGALRPGDRVWLRHAKAGELAERFTDYQVLDGDQVTAVPTYRGEGQCFG